MPTINLSYARLLREVYEQLELDVPECVVSPDSDGQFVGSIDIQIPRGDTIVETVRCEGARFPTHAAAEQDAARRALKKVKDECDLEVRDINYEDSVIYKNLYAHQTTDYAVLFTQYNNLTREYNILKECYIATLAQKNEYINERIMLRQAIGECYAAVNRLAIDPPPAAADPPADMSNQLP